MFSSIFFPFIYYDCRPTAKQKLNSCNAAVLSSCLSKRMTVGSLVDGKLYGSYFVLFVVFVTCIVFAMNGQCRVLSRPTDGPGRVLAGVGCLLLHGSWIAYSRMFTVEFRYEVKVLQIRSAHRMYAELLTFSKRNAVRWLVYDRSYGSLVVVPCVFPYI